MPEKAKNPKKGQKKPKINITNFKNAKFSKKSQILKTNAKFLKKAKFSTKNAKFLTKNAKFKIKKIQKALNLKIA